MGRFIVQVQGRYALWSEVVDAPLTPFVTSLERLAEVLPRDAIVALLNTAPMYQWSAVMHNRAGEHETCLRTPEALLAAYPDEPEEAQQQMPENTGQEPAARLYGVVRDLGILPPAWGPWASLSQDMQGDLRRAAARLWPEPELAEVASPLPCTHEWQSAGYDDAGAGLMLYCLWCALVRRYVPSQVPSQKVARDG